MRQERPGHCSLNNAKSDLCLNWISKNYVWIGSQIITWVTDGPKTLFRKLIGTSKLTAPTLKGDLKLFGWGPNGDPVLSEMGTKWGPSAAEMGTQKANIPKIDRNVLIYSNKEVFKNIFIHRERVCYHLMHIAQWLFILNNQMVDIRCWLHWLFTHS